MLPGSSRRRVQAWLPQLLAASFFLATVGLSMHVRYLRGKMQETPAEPSRWEAGATFVQLAAANDAERGHEDKRGKEIPGSRTAILILDPPGAGAFPSYRFDIVKADGPVALVKSVPVSPRSPEELNITIKPGSLEPGRYRILLQGIRDGRARLLERSEVFSVQGR